MQDGKHVILAVDDDPDFLLALRMVLESNGYRMLEAGSVVEGMKAYRQGDPDLILVDLMMEEVDAGTRLVTELKAAGCDKPIYMLSCVGDALDSSTDTSQLGLAGVFQKPINSEVLLRTLKSRLK